MKNKWINKLTGNIPLKLIALAVAFLIWLLVSNNNNPTQTKLFSNVPITMVNQSSVADIGKVVEPEGNGLVTLRVKERQKILERLSRNDFYVEADMENINDMDTVPLTVSCTNTAVTWDEIEVSPSSLKVTLEDKVEQTFAVSVTTSGSPANGFEVGSTEILQGKTIYIAGPESVMKIINQVVAPVNVSGMNDDMTLAATLKVYDKNGSDMQDKLSTLELKDSNGAVLTDGVVQVAVDIWRVRTDIALEVKTAGSPAFGYRVANIETIPGSISLAGTDDALRGLGGTLTVSDVVSVADASEDVELEIDLTATLAELEGLKLLGGADPSVQVEIRIEKNGDKTLSIPLSSVNMVNRPENRNLVFTPADKLSVSVRKEAAEAGDLTEEDMSISLDLSPCEAEGNHELTAEVTLPDGYELASPVTIMVNSEKTVRDTGETETE